MAKNDGPDLDRLKQESDRRLRQANDALDANRQAKRRASEQTADDVHRSVVGK